MSKTWAFCISSEYWYHTWETPPLVHQRPLLALATNSIGGVSRMLTFTIGELLDEDEKLTTITGPHCIYVVYDNSTVFYVGRSASIIERLWGHLGNEIHGGWCQFGHRASDLGRLIAANLPTSRNWKIDLLTLKECGCYTIFNIQTPTVEIVEATLIQLLRPCLNREFNRMICDKRLANYNLPWTKIPIELWPF